MSNAAGALVYHFPLTLLSLCWQADNRKRYKEEENDHLDDPTAADVAWSKHKLLNESIIVALFQGQFKSTVQCLTCHRKSRTFETFMYLSLPLASTSKCSLQVSPRAPVHQRRLEIFCFLTTLEYFDFFFFFFLKGCPKTLWSETNLHP